MRRQLQSIWVIAILLATGASAAHAQITDPEQDKQWVYLMHLSEERARHMECVYFAMSRPDSEKWDSAWPRYREKAATVAEEIESYLAKYSHTRTEDETKAAFRFRVWEAVLTTGQLRAERAFDPTLCLTILGKPKASAE